VMPSSAGAPVIMTDRKDLQQAAQGEHSQKRGALSNAWPLHNSLLERGCCLTAFLVPLKLSLTYCILIPLIIAWLASAIKQRRTVLQKGLPLHTLCVPLAFFLTIVVASALTGLNPLHSFSPTLSLIFFALSVPLFAESAKPLPTLIALIAGQSIAALHSVLDGAFPSTLSTFFLGKVTESGQLALTFFVALGLLWRTLTSLKNNNRRADIWRLNCLAATSAVLVALFAFRTDLGTLSHVGLWAAPLGIGAALLLTKRIATGNIELRLYAWLAVAVIPLLNGALLVNLKRGPWFGVLIGSLVFCGFFARRLLVAIIALSALIFVALPPVQSRLGASYDDFTMSGGRSTIWRIGAELCAQYPLGIGYRNSGILRKFATEIPEELDHFHNNLLNITAESGWLATLLFLWFIATAVRICCSKPYDPLLVAIGCAVISSQMAGIVEYNAGDAEVLIVTWVLLGVSMRLRTLTQPQTNVGAQEHHNQ
jgi:O-antigen ligase